MLATQAASRQTVSVSWTRSQEVWRLVLMAGNIRRFWRPSLGDSFFRNLRLVKDSETPRKRAEASQFAPETIDEVAVWQPSLNPDPASALTVFTGADNALRAVLKRCQAEQGLPYRG